MQITLCDRQILERAGGHRTDQTEIVIDPAAFVIVFETEMRDRMSPAIKCKITKLTGMGVLVAVIVVDGGSTL